MHDQNNANKAKRIVVLFIFVLLPHVNLRSHREVEFCCMKELLP